MGNGHNIEIVNPLEKPDWNKHLMQNPNASFFHTSNWARVLADTYGYTPFYFTEIDNNRILSLLPLMEIKSILTGKRGASLPFTDSCPLIAPDDVGFRRLLSKATEFGRQRGWKTIELRGKGPELMNSAVSSATYLTHSLCLASDTETQFSAFRSNTRRNIRKAIRKGVSTAISTSMASVKQFSRLNCLTRREHGLPPQPEGFFSNIFKSIVSKGNGIIALASHHSEAVAGAIYFNFGKEAIYKYGASDKRYQHLRPNNLVMWKAIEHYASNGFKNLSFGRTDLDHKGLLQFKRGWGTQEKELHYYRIDPKSNTFISKLKPLKTSYSIFKVLPIPFLKLMGRLLYRHVG